jgi:hypothetical protein
MKWLRKTSRGEGEVTVLLTLIVLALVIAGMSYKAVRSFNRDHTETELTARVLSTEIKGIGTGDDRADHYLISVQPVNKVDGVYEPIGEAETIEVADSRIHQQYRSADIYFTLQQHIGAVYHFKLQGWRDGYYSEFRNIYEYTLVQDKGR